VFGLRQAGFDLLAQRQSLIDRLLQAEIPSAALPQRIRGQGEVSWRQAQQTRQLCRLANHLLVAVDLEDEKIKFLSGKLAPFTFAAVRIGPPFSSNFY
jgi:hypothetical protein